MSLKFYSFNCTSGATVTVPNAKWYPETNPWCGCDGGRRDHARVGGAAVGSGGGAVGQSHGDLVHVGRARATDWATPAGGKGTCWWGKRERGLGCSGSNHRVRGIFCSQLRRFNSPLARRGIPYLCLNTLARERMNLFPSAARLRSAESPTARRGRGAARQGRPKGRARAR